MNENRSVVIFERAVQMLAEADTIQKIESNDRKDEEVAGIYAIFFETQCIYIGESENIRKRLANHDYKEWMNFHGSKLMWFATNNRKAIEKKLIDICHPLLNNHGCWLHCLAINEARGTPVEGVKKFLEV